MRSLSARLVATTVALVVAVSVLIGAAATVAIHNRLTGQVDEQLNDVVRQVPFLLGPGPGGGPRANSRPGTVIATYPDDPSQDGVGIRTTVSRDEDDELPDAVRDRLGEVEADGQVHDVDLAGLGDYRVQAIAVQDGAIVVGLPTDEVDDAVRSLIGYEAWLIAIGALLTAGGGLILVRRQLQPLRDVARTAHSVAELPLAEGDVEVVERVPQRLTDERTEVGQVGAALNTLLDHVETSLTARHRSEQQVRQFVADASHELRTPLATIAGYTELARRRPDDTAMARTALGKVEAEAARMTALVEDLLLLARLDAGRPLAQEPVDLIPLLVEAVSDARVLSPEHLWRLELPDEPVEVTGDEARLHQVVTNLLTNARKHTPAGTTVTVAALPDGFAVRDDGPGLPESLRATAFERFARADVARTRGPDSGAGLGLALVAAIVGALDGGVTLDSRPGRTTIRVTLPR